MADPAARFPALKGPESFNFAAIPSLNKTLVMELARCGYIQHREKVIAVGKNGNDKVHVALGLAASGDYPWASRQPTAWCKNSWLPSGTWTCPGGCAG